MLLISNKKLNQNKNKEKSDKNNNNKTTIICNATKGKKKSIIRKFVKLWKQCEVNKKWWEKNRFCGVEEVRLEIQFKCYKKRAG